MSYDISLTQIVTEEKEVADIGNYTYNISPMYQKAMNISLYNFDGMKASEAIDILQKGLIDMTNNSLEYEKLNPENGWGDYQGAMNYLSKLLVECRKHPHSTIHVY